MTSLVRRFASTRHITLFQRTTFSLRRCYSTPSPETVSKLELPDDAQYWTKHFKVPLHVNHRISTRNKDTAEKIANAFVPEGSKGKVVIEAYPGPGQLTRALLNLPKERIRKLIVLEDWAPYVEYLKPLQEMDSRVVLLQKSSFDWGTYTEITEQGLLDDVATVGWDQGVHPELQFISHLPSTVYSEQLISQFLRSMPDRNWLFRYGRVPLNFILSDHLLKRIVATVKDAATRCKLSIVAEATAQCSAPLNFEDTHPYEQHFHPLPPPGAKSAEMKKDSRAVGRPFRAMTIVPLKKQFIPKGQMDAWDYCLRRLYVKKSTPLVKALSTLAPGAQILAKAVSDPELPASQRLDVSKRIKDMDARDWSVFMKAFDDWPFKPEDLGITQTWTSSSRS